MSGAATKHNKQNTSMSSQKNSSETSRPKPKISLDHLKVVATWEYVTENSDCSLCHKDLMTPVAVTDHSKTTYVNGIVIGTCQHGFHDPCIGAWIKHGNVSCPRCKTPWKPNRNVSSGVYIYKSTV